MAGGPAPSPMGNTHFSAAPCRPGGINDARTFFTYLTTAASTAIAGWSLKLEMFLGMVLVGGTLLLVTSLYRTTDPGSWLIVWMPFSALLFSLLQRRSWLWAMQSLNFF